MDFRAKAQAKLTSILIVFTLKAIRFVIRSALKSNLEKIKIENRLDQGITLREKWTKE